MAVDSTFKGGGFAGFVQGKETTKEVGGGAVVFLKGVGVAGGFAKGKEKRKEVNGYSHTDIRI